ncbi:nitrate- and nitrite sensing domain-containing protein [Catenulispora yoronensis]|uniref:nitrate- and nitrite sensing domain-containing protein n=1 Tax=Catenulispora yoronensis TaxID=450799 RepID=UPI0031DE2EC4
MTPRRPPAPFPERGVDGPPSGGSISDAAAGRPVPRGPRDSVLPGQRPIPAADPAGDAGGQAPPPPPPSGQANRFSPKNWRVRTRLVVLVIVPLVATIVGAAARIAQQVGNVQTYDHAKTMAAAEGPLSNLIDALHNERDNSVEMMAFRDQKTPDQATLSNLNTGVEQLRKTTDKARATILPVLNKIDGSYPKDTLAAIADAKANMSTESSLIQAVNRPFSNPMDVFNQYNKLLDSLNTLYQFVAADAGDQQLINNARALSDLAKMTETTSRERGFLTALSVHFDPNQAKDNSSTLQGLVSDLASTRAEFKTIAGSQMQQMLSDTVDVGDSYTGANQYLTTIGDELASGVDNGVQLVPGTVYFKYDSVLNKYQKVRAAQAKVLVDRANALANDARNTMYLNIGVIIGVLIIVSIATALIARSLVRPLRVLQNTALEIAGSRLPEMVRRLRDADGSEPLEPINPIALTSTDEVGQVARAFDEVHREAVRLATEQAMLRNNVNAMFTNLSRRSQSLVQRQLRLIDELENAEQDPDQLASLFKLDHLATRMRRNGENLLVLAGEEPGRRWSQPVPLIDVLRAAASEVEQYERVTLRDLPTVEVAGRAVNDVVHLVAELLENATSFSAPETKVSVTGNLLNTGGVMLEIEDSGIGMTPEELDDANERLANPPVVDVAISRRMGLFVVGRLATRHGIQVRLRRSATGGITALVLVPAALLAGNLADAPAIGRNALGELTTDTGQQPAVTATGLPRRPGGPVRADQRELPGQTPELPPMGRPQLPQPPQGPFGGERVSAAPLGLDGPGGRGPGAGDGWEDVSPAAPPYRGTGSTPPDLADLLAETDPMSGGVVPVIREGDAGDSGSAFERPAFSVPEPELDGRLAEALDNSATYDFRPGADRRPGPPEQAENSGQFRISADDGGDMRLNFNVGNAPTPPPAPPAPTGGLNLSSSFDDLLPNIPEMEQTGEFAAYRDAQDQPDDLLLPPPSGPSFGSGPTPAGTTAADFRPGTGPSSGEAQSGSGMNNDLGAELAAGDPFAAPGEVRMTPFGGHRDSGFGSAPQAPALPEPQGSGEYPAPGAPTPGATNLPGGPGGSGEFPAFGTPGSGEFPALGSGEYPVQGAPAGGDAPSFGQHPGAAPAEPVNPFAAPSGQAPSFGVHPGAPAGQSPSFQRNPFAPGGDGPSDSGSGFATPLSDAAASPFAAPAGPPAPTGEPLAGFDAPANPFAAPGAPAGDALSDSGSGFHTPLGDSGSYGTPLSDSGSYSTPLSDSGSFGTPLGDTGSFSAPLSDSGSGFATPLSDAAANPFTAPADGLAPPTGEPLAGPAYGAPADPLSGSGLDFATDPLTAPIESVPMDSDPHDTAIFNAIESEWFRVRAQGATPAQSALEAGAVPVEPVRPIIPEPRVEAAPPAAAPLPPGTPVAPATPVSPVVPPGATVLPPPAAPPEPEAPRTAPAAEAPQAAFQAAPPTAPPTAPPVAPPVPPTVPASPFGGGADVPTPPSAGPAAPAPAPHEATPHEERKEPMNDDQSSAGQPWQSPGDEGWRAAEVVKKPVAAGLTPKGLPKRVPRSNLVPGSADGVGAAKAAAPPIPARSAEAVRSRLASFHQGLRQGRDAAGGPGDPQPTDTATNPTASDGPAAFGAPSQESRTEQP